MKIRAWHTVLAVNLAALTGLGAGYLVWGRQAERVAAELKVAKAIAPRPEREWKDIAGVVRGVMPEMGVVVLSHDDMPGYMRPMTMGFKVESPQLYEGLQVGDPVQFTLRGVPPRVRITQMQKVTP
ncbi:MAG TPA: copper-binding protein [Albitalea sp.]